MPENDNIPAIIGVLEPREIYPVTEDELRILERGGKGSLSLNFAIALLSLAFSSLFAFLTFENPSIVALGIMFGVMVAGLSLGILLIISWYKAGSSHKEVLAKIRARIEAEKNEQ